jgi:predicted metal-dependent enzyme (double-stranded beta helix superfamily)
MAKSLHRMTKAELVATVQDYQEMVSEIEDIINGQVDKSEPLLQIREVLNKYLMGPREQGGAA